MKRTFSKMFGIAMLFACSQCFLACHKSNDDTPNPVNTPASGKWKVAYFWDKKDETSHFANYTFNFASNGTITATNSQQTYTGTWTMGFDDSKNKFLINFTGNAPDDFTELNEDWLIVEMTDKSMHFEHTSGGNGDTDILKFTK